ncbi:MAG: hypothetical protein HYY24_29870 [Verrucomicrobia bacterium]|nr:hypothetical protein [Verrucomicrobiota bacterium]
MKTPTVFGHAVRGLLAALVFAGVCAGAERVFRLEETHPVQGMPNVRAVRETAGGPFKPAEYRANKRGWVIVAASFEAYKARAAAKSETVKQRVKVESTKDKGPHACLDVKELKKLPLDQQIEHIRKSLTAEERRRFDADVARQRRESAGWVCSPRG